MEEKEEYVFAMGSLKFKTFKELYDNIKDKTGTIKSTCSILLDDNAVMSFPLTYEKNILNGKHRFVLEWEVDQLNTFNVNPDMSQQLKGQLPKFQVVGSVAKTATDVTGPSQKLYGYLNIAALK